MPNRLNPLTPLPGVLDPMYASLSGYGAPTQINPTTALPGVMDPVYSSMAANLQPAPVTGTAAIQPTTLQGMTGYTAPDGTQFNGWGGMALGAAQAGANLFMGMKNYGLAKDSLKESRRQFDLNYGAQRDTLNTRMEDRQRARVASNPTAYQSVGDYMDQNRIR